MNKIASTFHSFKQGLKLYFLSTRPAILINDVPTSLYLSTSRVRKFGFYILQAFLFSKLMIRIAQLMKQSEYRSYYDLEINRNLCTGIYKKNLELILLLAHKQ